jgi:DNA-binding transcriptional ArsR family regulator
MMHAETPSQSMALDRTLMALADPTRRSILQRLSRGPARVTEVAQPFPISLNSVSKHIRILERARLVRRRRAGREHILSIDTRPLAHAGDWIQRQRALWTARLDTLEALLRAEDAEQAARDRRGRP